MEIVLLLNPIYIHQHPGKKLPQVQMLKKIVQANEHLEQANIVILWYCKIFFKSKITDWKGCYNLTK